MLIEMGSSYNHNYETLFDFILDDKAYFRLYNFIERANKDIQNKEQFMESTSRESYDGLHLSSAHKRVRVYNYEAYAIDYYKQYQVSERSYYPHFMQHDGVIGRLPIIPLRYEPSETPSDVANILLAYNDAYLDSTDKSAELFQLSLNYNVLTPEEIHAVMVRMYNLPILPEYEIKLFSSLLHLDRLYDLDVLFRGTYE